MPPEADVSAVADAIVKLVDTPFGKRSFRGHIGATQDGAEVVNAVSDRARAELLCNRRQITAAKYRYSFPTLAVETF
ncbi:MAG TPA: hypothetical protein VN901_21225 [Candidatus Acidoferrales bacterium]|nr:hypothetical protein [Candidatus Acidoferrales bacterium]